MFFVQSTVSLSNLWLAAVEKSIGTKYPEMNHNKVDTDNHKIIQNV